ncbi:MAG: MBL fold metallo-hydrolase [Candidatus Marsarchaeota archaeon]|nr:MBL fold metallo-hydrolase [Candidatus Marsarchaeota archaeon]MCL5413310.1 MBL fold metallo-hydrolase [Candidatus Marsarchaeota archaeon]
MAIRVGEHRISLDVRDPEASLNFVSHAHSDHTAGVRKTSTILCSEATKDLVETRVNYRLNVADMPKSVSLLDSGHMLGSKQLYVEADGYSIVYTGDYQMQESPVADIIEVKKADVLIIDSTYPFPNVTFDDNSEVITAMQHYMNSKKETGSILFGAYAMGKSQELVKICNDIGISPIVDSNIAKINDIYSKHGIRLDYSARSLEEGLVEGDFRNPVWIVSMNKMNRVLEQVSSMNMRVFTAVATGFARMQRFNTDVQFALSDHADFSQAIDYISQCNPDIIYTRGSNRDTFAKNLRAYGYNAEALGSSNMNTMLLSYV